MANINDFKIINARSINKFKYVTDELNVSYLMDELQDIQKARLGFYYLTMEVLTGVSDFRTIDECIIDCDYNKILHGKGIDDLGIDAIYMDETDGNHIIYLFTYKFREKFNPEKNQEEEAILK